MKQSAQCKSLIIKFTLFNDCCSNLRRFPYKGSSEFFEQGEPLQGKRRKFERQLLNKVNFINVD